MLERNPNYRGGTYPCEGQPGDQAAGLLDDCGKRTPFVDTLYVTHRERTHAAQGEVQAGLSRRAEIRAPRLGRELKADRQDSDEVHRVFEEKFFPLTADISN